MPETARISVEILFNIAYLVAVWGLAAGGVAARDSLCKSQGFSVFDFNE